MRRPGGRIRAIVGLLILVGTNPGVTRGADEAMPRVNPAAILETEPIPSQGDAADDPAIWIHPTDGARSLVLGTDKKGGLNVFNLDGKRTQVVSDGARPNNVDVLYGFPMGDRLVDLAVAGTRTKSRFGAGFWSIDPTTLQLSELGSIPAFTVFGGGEPYGSCVFRSPRDHAFYWFVTSKEGAIEQYRLDADGRAAIRGTRVRSLKVGSTAEGCVADFDLSWLYVAEEDVGIWRFGAEPDSPSAGTLIARVGEHGLTADVEGLTIYYAKGSQGYLIASSQGAGTFQVYERQGSNRFTLTIDPSAGPIGDVGQTDGIDVTSVALSPRFPRGLFVCQDGQARAGHQNFKFFAWDQIAGDHLVVDTGRHPGAR